MAQDSHLSERPNTVVIGGGQAGLAVGYQLAQRKIPFLIVDAGERIGEAWRNRWDTLRLFTPAGYSSLDGMPYPADGDYYPTKDEMANYLEAYATYFELPVRLGFEVDHLSRDNGQFRIASGNQALNAKNVVVAMSSYQQGRVPDFARTFNQGIQQMHSADYRRPGQLQDGDALVVGAANSGAEIALDLATTRRVWLAGRHPGHLPFDIESWAGRHWLMPITITAFQHWLMSVDNPLGRRARASMMSQGVPLVRSKPRDLDEAGIESVPRVAGVENGRPLLEDGRSLDVSNVIWCTGFSPGFSWIDLDVLDGDHPRHHSGIVDEQPGLYFVGLAFLHALSSSTLYGVNRDAARIADAIAAR